MSGYRFICPAASVAAASTPGSGGYGFSLLDNLYVGRPSVRAGGRPGL